MSNPPTKAPRKPGVFPRPSEPMYAVARNVVGSPTLYRIADDGEYVTVSEFHPAFLRAWARWLNRAADWMEREQAKRKGAR